MVVHRSRVEEKECQVKMGHHEEEITYLLYIDTRFQRCANQLCPFVVNTNLNRNGVRNYKPTESTYKCEIPSEVICELNDCAQSHRNHKDICKAI